MQLAVERDRAQQLLHEFAIEQDTARTQLRRDYDDIIAQQQSIITAAEVVASDTHVLRESGGSGL